MRDVRTKSQPEDRNHDRTKKAGGAESARKTYAYFLLQCIQRELPFELDYPAPIETTDW